MTKWQPHFETAKIPFETHGRLPQIFKDQVIAYSVQEGGKFQFGKPSEDAVIFVFEDGTVYDEIMLDAYSAPWRELHPAGLKFIQDQRTSQ